MASDIYYNARLSQREVPGQPPETILAAFSDNRPSPLLQKASDYRMSVIQFNVSVHDLPLLAVEHPNQTGQFPTETFYTFTIKSAAASATATVQWTPQENIAQTTGDLGDAYWYCYDFITFGVSINAALQQAMTSLIALDPTQEGTPPPFFQYNNATATWLLFAPQQFQEGNADGLQLFANEQAYHLFQGFPMFGDNRLPLDQAWRFLIIHQGGESFFQIGEAQYILRQQTPGSLCSWNPVQRIVFTTASIPIVSESTNPQSSYATGQDVGSGNASQQILTDITPQIVRGDELASGTIYYTPSAEYRFSDMMSDAPLTNVDFRIWWADYLGGLHPLRLSHNGTSSAKLLFRRK
ncbi:MAG: hypothetical protein Q7U97_04260 [Rhodocyclaceae bacterium]|nr:hypothetical protein [Rhodocyclaceae bacterium]